MRRTSRGMVAEKSAICRSAGACDEDPLDVLDEAHASISSASSSTTTRTASRRSAPAPQVVHDPSRRADHDVDAALQPLELELDRLRRRRPAAPPRARGTCE